MLFFFPALVVIFLTTYVHAQTTTSSAPEATGNWANKYL